MSPDYHVELITAMFDNKHRKVGVHHEVSLYIARRHGNLRKQTKREIVCAGYF